ncbi:MAG TPA: hypothetical protein VKP30_08330 [Polyangiaceae bacterium]|nr:hypothetical protein [Polyangiaceae bacterium]
MGNTAARGAEGSSASPETGGWLPVLRAGGSAGSRENGSEPSGLERIGRVTRGLMMTVSGVAGAIHGYREGLLPAGSVEGGRDVESVVLRGTLDAGKDAAGGIEPTEGRAKLGTRAASGMVGFSKDLSRSLAWSGLSGAVSGALSAPECSVAGPSGGG